MKIVVVLVAIGAGALSSFGFPWNLPAAMLCGVAAGLALERLRA